MAGHGAERFPEQALLVDAHPAPARLVGEHLEHDVEDAALGLAAARLAPDQPAAAELVAVPGQSLEHQGVRLLGRHRNDLAGGRRCRAGCKRINTEKAEHRRSAIGNPRCVAIVIEPGPGENRGCEENPFHGCGCRRTALNGVAHPEGFSTILQAIAPPPTPKNRPGCRSPGIWIKVQTLIWKWLRFYPRGHAAGRDETAKTLPAVVFHTFPEVRDQTVGSRCVVDVEPDVGGNPRVGR